MASSPNNASDAIVFVPGIGCSPRQSIDGLAQRIAAAMNRYAESRSAEFYLESGQDIDYASYDSEPLKTRCRSVMRKNADQTTIPAVDVYEFSYQDKLTLKHRNSNDLTKAFRLFLVLISNIPAYFRAFFGKQHKQKDAKSKIQFLLALVILSMLIVYLVFLAGAVWGVIAQMPAVQEAITPATEGLTVQIGEPATGSDQGRTNPLTRIPAISLTVVVLVATIEIFFPGLRSAFTDSAIRYLGMIEYIDNGQRAPVLAGNFAQLLDYIEAQGYDRVHIIAYSFGTIIALDNLFPADQEPEPTFTGIETLVTIGCPYDLVNVFWPSYYTDRRALPKTPGTWFNIFAPTDVMGSNFRMDQKDEPPESVTSIKMRVAVAQSKLIPDKNVSYYYGQKRDKNSAFQLLVLAGLKAHADYWERDFEFERTAFDPVISAMFEGEKIMA